MSAKNLRGPEQTPAKLGDLTESSEGLAIALSDNEALLRVLNVHFQISVTDLSGRITEVNDNFCRISGYSRTQLVGQPHSIVNSGTQGSRLWGEMWCRITAGQPWRGEICNRAHDGSLHWSDSIVAPMIAVDGQTSNYVSIRTDITDAYLIRQKLRASETFLTAAGRTARIGSWALDLRTGIVNWSAEMNRINETPLDYQPTLEEGFGLYVKESRPAIERAVAEARRTGTGWDLELQKATAKGTLIWVRSVAEAELEEGSPVRMIGTTQDITARKKIESSLMYERDLMNSLLETLPDQIYFKDSNSRYLRVNPGMARHYRMKNPAEAPGKSDADYLTPQYAERIASIERKIMESGTPVLELEELQEWLDRPATWNLSTRMPLYDGMDTLIGTFGVSRDITARKNVDAQLKASNDRFALAAGSAGIGVWEYDVVNGRLIWDERMYSIYGIPRTDRAESLELWINALHPEDRQRCENEFAASLRGEQEFESDFRILRPDGTVRCLKCASRTLHTNGGTASSITGVSIDVSERRHVELELLKTSSLLRTVLDSVAEVAIIATDPSFTITIFNAGAEKLLGYASRDLVDRQTPMVLHDPVEIHSRGAMCGSTNNDWSVVVHPSLLNKAQEWNYVCKDGRRVNVSQIVVPMHSQAGELLGYVAVAQNISRRKQYEESLRETTRRAEHASRAKSEFLANMSHEIRTPMNAVIGLSYILGQTPLSEEQASLLGKIGIASKALLGIINDVLDLSKIEAGELLVECTPFVLRDLLNQLADSMAVQAQVKGIAFRIEVQEDLPANLKGDAKHLRQILTNLLSNAIRFTERGCVVVRVNRIDVDSPGVTICFTVQDTGIGISQEAQARIFEPFAQADASITRRFGGTGLGLSIVKSLVGSMGGEISLTSSPGVGSEFKVVINFVEPEPLIVAHPEGEDIQLGTDTLWGVRALIVDDSDINLDVTKRILEMSGAKVGLASNGLEAFQQLQARPHDFDVVLMDVQMPVLDGYAATERIRLELALVDLPIIALTAGALSSERQRALHAGMVDFIIKPFDAPTLTHSILRHVRGASARGATPIDASALRPGSVPSPWPVIDGIDSATSRSRLLNDSSLLRSILRRLLAEFSDMGIPEAAHDPESLTAHANRLHKLKGSAGMLGAKEIHELAGEAERACRAGKIELASELARSLTGLLERLRVSAAPVLEQTAGPQAGPGPEQNIVELESAQIDDFIKALRQQGLDAVESFIALSPRLQRLVGEECFRELRAHMDGLEFSKAADVLEGHRSGLNSVQR